MTWNRFKRLVLRSNIAVLGLGWICFWGYGVAVGDIPPASVLPGLLALSAIAIVIVSAALFFACHSWLFLKAKQTGDLPNLTKRDYQAVILAFGSALILGLGIFVHHSGSGVPDAIAIPASILCVLGLIYGSLYWGLGLASQYFRWQFSKTS